MYLVERDSHDAVRHIKSFFDAIAVMDIDIDVEHTRMIPIYIYIYIYIIKTFYNFMQNYIYIYIFSVCLNDNH